MKTSELVGAHLSYWVAMAERTAEGTNFRATLPPAEPEIDLVGADGRSIEFAPWRDWAQGGPIMERERIAVVSMGGQWCAFRPGGIAAQMSAYEPFEDQVGHGYIDVSAVDADATGPTMLIAAMRAYVESKFGPEVSDESAEVFADKKRNG